MERRSYSCPPALRQNLVRALCSLFLKRTKPPLLPAESSPTSTKPPGKCATCLDNYRKATVNLNGDVVPVLLRSFLLPTFNFKPSPAYNYSLAVCKGCAATINKLKDLFLQLEDLRSQFNNVRKLLGQQIILSTLKRPEPEWTLWYEQIQNVEHIFPSCYSASLKEQLEIQPRVNCNLVDDNFQIEEPFVTKPVPPTETEEVWCTGNNGINGVEFENEDVETFQCEQSQTSEQNRLTEDDPNDKQSLVNVRSPSPRPFGCPLCQKTFTQPVDVRRHIDRVHSQSSPKVRRVDDQQQTNSVNPLAPPTTTNPTNPNPSEPPKDNSSLPRGYKCEKCSKIFQNKKSHALHVEFAHMEFKCRICSKQLTTRLGLENHEKTHERIVQHLPLPQPEPIDWTQHPNRCPLCPAVLSRAQDQRQHFYNAHPQLYLKHNPFACRICFHTFPSALFLNAHMEKHRNLKCPICDKFARDLYSLNTHLRVHTRQQEQQQQEQKLPNFKCDICEHQFTSQENLTEHTTTAHNDDDGREGEREEEEIDIETAVKVEVIPPDSD